MQQHSKQNLQQNSITPVMSTRYYEMKNDSTFTNECIQFDSMKPLITKNSMISKALALTSKPTQASLNIANLNPKTYLNNITTISKLKTTTGTIKKLNIEKDDVKKTNEDMSYIIEPRKFLFIKDEDEEDELEQVDKKHEFENISNTSNDYFDDVSCQSPDSSFLTFSNNSSGFSTPTNSLKNDDNNNEINNNNNTTNSELSCDMNYLSNQLITSQITSSIRAASAAFADILCCPNSNKRSLGYSNFDLNEKRTFHILSERRRRYDLKKLFENLRTNIPSLSNKQKASKVTILKTAVDHLVDITNNNDQLKRTFQIETLKQKKLMNYLRSLEQVNLYSNNENYKI